METKSQPNDLPPVLVSEDQTRHEPAPELIDPVFLQHVTRATTSYSEGWRDVCARLLWAENAITRLQGENARLRLERDSAREQFDRHVEWAAGQSSAAEAALSALRSAVKQIEQRMRQFHPAPGGTDKGRFAIALTAIQTWADTLAVIVTQEENEKR